MDRQQIEIRSGAGQRRPYQKPDFVSYTMEEILAETGPAVAAYDPELLPPLPPLPPLP